MSAVTIVGILAACASTGSFAPQAWKIIRERQTRGISIGMYGLTVVGFGLWIGYGVMRQDWPLIVPNAVCLMLASFILLMSVLPQRQKEAVADTLDPAERRRVP